MRSSTSNSDAEPADGDTRSDPQPVASAACAAERAPEGPWGRTWLAALALALVALGAHESYWRHRGHRPSVRDNEELWSYHRRRLVRPQVSPGRGPARQLALLGLSRMAVGCDLVTLRERLPDWRIAQLAIVGRHPLATLHDLALDGRFRGVVICEASEPGFERTMRRQQQEYVEHFRRQASPDARWNCRIAAEVESRWVLAGSNTAPLRVLRSLWDGDGLPAPGYQVIHVDRSIAADYQRADAAALAARVVGNLRASYASREQPSPAAWAEQTAEVRPWVDAIHKRGGQVIFVRFPVTGDSWSIHDQAYPRADYWDRLSELSGATTLHFRDHPQLADFTCPDTSHLDERDTPRFTAALIDELERRGLLRNE